MPGLDLHAHLAPQLADDELTRLGVARDGARLVLDGHAVGPPGLYAPELLVDHLAAIDLDGAVVSIPPPLFRQRLDAERAAAWCRAANDGLARAVAPHAPLHPLAYLPFEHPERALAEYERVRGEPCWVGVAASAGGRSVSLADARLAPLWERLDADAALLLLHPGSSPDARLDPFYLGNLLGNPVETTLAAAQLVFGEVLVRHPRLRVLLVHCGGCVANVVGRWDRGAATDRPGLPALAEPPSASVRRLWIDCLAHDPAVVDLAVQTFGADKLVLGSDWPFPMGSDDPRTLVAHLGDELAGRIAVDNARAALGEPVAPDDPATI